MTNKITGTINFSYTLLFNTLNKFRPVKTLRNIYFITHIKIDSTHYLSLTTVN